MNTLKISNKKQKGAALFVGLVILLIMTIVAVTAMQSTTMEVRMAKNDNLTLNAFETSEGPRPLAGEILDEHIYERGWEKDSTNNFIDFLPGLQLKTLIGGTLTDCTPSTNANCTPKLYNNNDVDEDILDTNSLTKDMRYRFSSGGGISEISIYQIAVKLASGNSAAMLSGYEGTGKSAAASGGRMYFDIRSVGQYGKARSTTDADYRIIINN
ncbi:MAG: PilX N-terminal domain-containing pilus assembly protein [Methylococcales bacterium]